MIEQHRRELEVGVHRCDAQRTRAVGRDVVDIGASLQQRDGRVGVRVAHGEEQRRQTAVRLQLQVGARFDQHVNRGGIAFGRGPHQRGLTSIRFLGVHAGAARQQQPHGVRFARQRRGHQHRLAFLRGAVRIGARFQQALDRGRVAVDGGEVQRRDVVAG